MRKYQKLKSEYETMEQQCTRLKAELMECQYKFETLYKEYQEQKEQQEEIKSLHESARRLKHDMKNHMLVLAAYLNDMEINEAKEYVSNVFEKLNQMYTYIETGNTILNYCINAKLQKANERKIEFKVQVENLRFQRVSSVDLSAILTNLLDNAIEGTQKTEHPFIEIVISKKRAYETILIKNRIEESVLAKNPELHTTKVEHIKTEDIKEDIKADIKEEETKAEETRAGRAKKEKLAGTLGVIQSHEHEHGYGINQVKTLIKKYDGMIDFYEEEKMFCVQVAICE